MINIRKFLVVIVVSSIVGLTFTGVVVAEQNNCTNITDIVDITNSEDTSIQIEENDIEDSPFYSEDQNRMVITGETNQWIEFACWALNN